MNSPEHARLLARYLSLTNEALPQRARAGRWVVNQNHCFQRILLDHLFEDVWYHHLDRRRVAYRQLSNDQLRRAIAMGEEVLRRGDDYLRALNRDSLRWRGKLQG